MAAADQDELERVGRLLRAADEPEDARRAAFEDLIRLARSGDPAVKTQVGAFLPAPFSAFPDLQERAVDIVYDLCEDEDSAVRRSGYACFALLSASSPAWVQRNTDVLSQLLAVDAGAERAQIRSLIGEHVRLAPAKALRVVFDVLEDAEAGSNVKDELYECFREGQLNASGAEWEAALWEGGERLLSSSKVALPAGRTLLVLKALAQLPAASESIALAQRTLSCPPLPAAPYAYYDDRYTSLASSLPHDPRPITSALVRQLEHQRYVPLPPRETFRPDDGQIEKALVAALGEWSTLANELGGYPPADVDQKRWEDFQRTVVSNLTLKALPLLRSQPLSVAMLEYLLWTLYHLYHIPHVDRRTIGPNSAFQRAIASLPLPVLPSSSSPLARATANLTSLLRFFRSNPSLPTARPSRVGGRAETTIFAPPSVAGSSVTAGVGPLADRLPSWLPERSRLPTNDRSYRLEDRSPQRHEQRSRPAPAPRTSAGQMMDRPGPTTMISAPSDRRPPVGPRSIQLANLGGPSLSANSIPTEPRGAAGASLLSRISPNTSGTSTPQLADRNVDVTPGPRVTDRSSPEKKPSEDLIDGFSIAGKAIAAQSSSMSAELSAPSARPTSMGIAIKGRGSRQAPPVGTSAATGGSTNGDDHATPAPSLQPTPIPARSLLERLGGSSSIADEDRGGHGREGGRKRKSNGDRRGRNDRGGPTSDGNKQARF